MSAEGSPEALTALFALRGDDVEVRSAGAPGQRWVAPRWFGGVVLGEAPGPAPEVRRFLRDGFRYTPFRLRRPAQWLWGTGWSVAPFWSPPLAEVRWRLAPPPRGAERLLVLPLRRKVRLFDFAAGRCLVARLPGADRDGFDREVALRATGEGPWPPLWRCDRTAGRYEEPLLEGFVLSRAPGDVDVRALAARALAEVERWAAPRSRVLTARQYAERLREEISALLDALWPERWTPRRGVAEALLARCLPSASEGEVRLAPAHGDLQLGNVLAERRGARLWVLDWEHQAELQEGHDRLVLGLASRSAGHPGPRLLALLSGSRRFPFGPFEPGLGARRRLLARFLLEELRFHLRESLVGGRPLPSAGLLRYLARGPRWALLLGRS